MVLCYQWFSQLISTWPSSLPVWHCMCQTYIYGPVWYKCRYKVAPFGWPIIFTSVTVWQCECYSVTVWQCECYSVTVWQCDSVSVTLWQCDNVMVWVWHCDSVTVWQCGCLKYLWIMYCGAYHYLIFRRQIVCNCGHVLSNVCARVSVQLQSSFLLACFPHAKASPHRVADGDTPSRYVCAQVFGVHISQSKWLHTHAG